MTRTGYNYLTDTVEGVAFVEYTGRSYDEQSLWVIS